MKKIRILATEFVVLVVVICALAYAITSVDAGTVAYHHSRAGLAIAFGLIGDNVSTDKCETCNGAGEVGDGVTMSKCEDCDGTGKKSSGAAIVKYATEEDPVEILEPPEPIKLPAVSADVDSWGGGSIAEAVVTHLASQEIGFQMPVGGLFDKEVSAPEFVPGLLRDLMSGKVIEIPDAGASVSWTGDHRTVGVDEDGMKFVPAVTVSVKKWGLKISTGLDGLKVSDDGRAVTLLLRRSPDLTLNITPETETPELVVDNTVVPEPVPVIQPAKSERDFALFVISNYRGTDYVERGTNDARESHLIIVHHWTPEAVSGLSRHQRRRLHGASHTGRVAALRAQFNASGGAIVGKPIANRGGRWGMRKFCGKDGCFTRKVWVSN
tara:strand:+ start:64075 stop:65217 length:1143 start_codon:yes stop_codon:yes gene_type:complete